MGKLSEITIDVKANLNVDRRTAETCLRLVEIFCNATTTNVIGHRGEDGYTTFEFERKSSTGISKETLDAINAIGRKTHGEE